MPNHCANSLKITATTPEARELLDAIRAEIAAERGFFHVIDPCPEELENTRAGYPKDEREAANIEKYGFAHWYDFQIARWGTKWNAYEIDTLADEGNTLTLNFDTAWSPPTALYQTMTEKGFEVEATFCESGADFIGYWINGTDHCEKLHTLAPPPAEDGEDNYPEECIDLDDYFTSHGIDHAPAHFGG